MLTSVSQLSGTSLRSNVVSDQIHELLSLINKNIIKENKLGTNVLVHDLPIVFRNINFSPEICRIIIYTAVIKELEQKGYQVSIKQSDNLARLRIEWSSGINNQEILCMKKYLQEHSI